MSAAADLIQGLNSQGVELRVAGDQLIVRAPKGSVGQETLEQLRKQKAQLIMELSVEDRLPPVTGRDAKSQHETRRQKVLQLMAQEPDRPRAWYVDSESDPRCVIVAFAKMIPDLEEIYTCEITIERADWDPFVFLELIEKEH